MTGTSRWRRWRPLWTPRASLAARGGSRKSTPMTATPPAGCASVLLLVPFCCCLALLSQACPSNGHGVFMMHVLLWRVSEAGHSLSCGNSHE